jgi:DNA repair exonuclease SbcCD ATPase subunit
LTTPGLNSSSSSEGEKGENLYQNLDMTKSDSKIEKDILKKKLETIEEDNKKLIESNKNIEKKNLELQKMFEDEKNEKESIIKELNIEKEKNQKLRNQIQVLEFRISNNFNPQNNYASSYNRRFSLMKPEEKVIAVTFETIDQKVKKCFPCKNTDIVVDLEKELYNEYYEYKDIETYLLCNGNKVFRFKTFEENGITNGSTVFINKNDE